MLRSLVGSEMCIRDRYQRRVRGFVSGLPWVGWLPGAASTQRSMALPPIRRAASRERPFLETSKHKPPGPNLKGSSQPSRANNSDGASGVFCLTGVVMPEKPPTKPRARRTGGRKKRSVAEEGDDASWLDELEKMHSSLSMCVQGKEDMEADGFFQEARRCEREVAVLSEEMGEASQEAIGS
eukprot:TRINITY_DN2899_c0_g1_i4.p1 TRINITY_DN2899_c0_g1~~TRINITY_DN2899_c0_g1_i4.p1  ORF type:complete len:213 (-),score=54.02 TRINITY_DN2899_c0_g1_i4:802-1347(-)